MSDSFEMLVDVEATAVNAEYLGQVVLERLRELELIIGEASAEFVLGKVGYRPGPAVIRLYQRGKRERKFWELATCGVEPSTDRWFNEWALGPVHEGFTCTSCAENSESFGDEFQEAVMNAIIEWMEQSGPAEVACPRCGKIRSIAEWECSPPLGFGYLSFTFWNWPPLDSPSWKIDITAIMAEATDHRIIRTYGHF